MKILVLTSRLPWPLDKGDKLRAYHQMRELAKTHDIYLFCLTSGNTAHVQAESTPLASIVRGLNTHRMSAGQRFSRLALAPLSSRPFQVHWFYQRAAQRSLDAWVNEIQPDLIYSQLVRMATYVQHMHHIPKVIDYMDALSAGIARQSRLAPRLMRWLYRIEYRRLRGFEATVFDYFDGKTIISGADRKLIQHAEHHLIEVVPNGIDTEFFSRWSLPEYHREDRVILFSGNMSYPPNVDAAKQLVLEVLPRIKTTGVRVLIAGTEPTPDVRALAGENIEVTGWMEDIRSAYARAALFVAPLRIGTGQQNKILEAMAMELPCITTQHVASGFPKMDSPAPLQVANSPEGLARHIDRFLSDENESQTVRSLSRQWVEKHCDWSTSTEKLTDTFVHSMSNETDSSVWPNQTPAS